MNAGGGGARAAAPGFDAIDWAAPWLAPFAARGPRWQAAALAGEADWLAALGEDAAAVGIATGRGRPLRFIAQSELPPGVAYETQIAVTGGVPTRHNLHDFFNALVWFAYPRFKAAINARQAEAIDTLGVGGARGGLRDALTLLDENGALFVCADPALGEALRCFGWQALFVEARAAWGRACELRLVGHALLEKLVQPYKACTAHAWIVAAPPAYFDWDEGARRGWLDAHVAAGFDARLPSSRGFAPVPVLGVPGWWLANQDPRFYEDAQVFRPGRRQPA
ncbi:DUF3025 domain-containing protein [Burkholderia gladioli]|uniref:DUF3025 domain-containing protein n=1 Tax=Burkholderia gladioli TaxID=28095 RepID=UPI0016417B1E|nr:DUF3025 domain-containing protein [Burkholderia gladioli]